MTSKKLLLLFIFQLLLPLEAHNRSESYSKFNFTSHESGAEVRITGTIKRGIFEAFNPGIKFRSTIFSAKNLGMRSTPQKQHGF